MIRTIAQVGAGVVIGAAVSTAGLLVAIVGALILFALWPTATADSLPPCPTEDSTHCYWDADTRGNGLGHDVVTLDN